MTTSIALFDCPHCVDEFAFDYQKIAKLTYGWRVCVRCPGCGNIVQVVMLAYTVIHGCDPTKYQAGEITEILPPARRLRRSGGWRLINSEWRFSKRRLDGDLSHAGENHGWMNVGHKLRRLIEVHEERTIVLKKAP